MAIKFICFILPAIFLRAHSIMFELEASVGARANNLLEFFHCLFEEIILH